MTLHLPLKARIVFAAGAAAAALCVIIGAPVAEARGLRLNVTPSLPYLLWVDTPVSQVRRDMVVTFCPPFNKAVRDGRRFGYFTTGPCPHALDRLMKPIAAVPGDLVTLDRFGVRVNGQLLRNSTRYRSDGAGNNLPRLPDGDYPVPPDTFWVISQHNPRSFDSRYFGPITRADILAQSRPAFRSDYR